MNLAITSGKEDVHHNLVVEKRFDTGATLAATKERLYMLTGTPPSDMVLALYQSNDENAPLIGVLSGDAKTLVELGVTQASMRIHVRDLSGKGDLFSEEALAAVPKYVMPDDVYDQRDGTYRQYKKEQAARSPAPVEKTTADYPQILVGARCLIEAGHRGEVVFFGTIKGKDGLFVGVRLDDPMGKNNGSVDGVSYFQAMPKCGIFARPEKIQVGDFPAHDELSSDEEI